MKRRVVITGLGAITPVGNNVNDFWNSIKEGRNGIDVITHFDTSKSIFSFNGALYLKTSKALEIFLLIPVPPSAVISVSPG